MAGGRGRLVVVGQGYVGLVLAIHAAEAGFDVAGFDVDEKRVKLLNAATSYVDDISSERLGSSLARGNFRATTDPRDIASFDFAVITVQTPLRDGIPDLSYIEAAAEAVGPHVRRGSCVVLESTTYPGTTAVLLRSVLEDHSKLRAGDDFFLGYSPERIDPGNGAWTLKTTPKIVSGVDDRSLQRIEDFYGAFVDHVVCVKGTAEAELAKLLENTFRHVNVALVNEIAVFAGELGIDVWESIDAASTKPFGFMRFSPGPGVGGHCLPIDPTYLSWKVETSLGKQFRFVELANEINAHMPEYVAFRVQLECEAARISLADGARVLLLGVAFKRDTSDCREAPALRIAELLTERGAHVVACDPHALEMGQLDTSPLTIVPLTPDELELADAVVLVTDHSDFDARMIQRHARWVLDTRHMLPESDNVDYL